MVVMRCWRTTFSTPSRGKARLNTKWVRALMPSNRGPHAGHGAPALPVLQTLSSRPPEHTRPPREGVQAPCRKSKRASPCARSGGTRARRMRRPSSARRDRLVRPCRRASLQPRCPALDALQPTPTGRARDRMLPSRLRPARSGQTRRPTWSRGGTRKRSRRCLATSPGMGRPCRRCRRCPHSSGSAARRGRDGRLAAPMGRVCCRWTHGR